MKKLLFVLSILSLVAVGCNRGEDQAGATGSGAGIEREESRIDGVNQQPEEEQYRDDDANITTPIDDRPDLEEEE